MSSDRLLVFARRPAAGRVKTRLSPPLPPDEAAAVYEACLKDVVALAGRDRARVELWYDGGKADEAYFAAHFAMVPRARQATGELGERLEDAFECNFAEGAGRTVIVGSDAPTLPDSSLHSAFDFLAEADVVLGPALDGGYYLVGLRREAWPRAAALFRDIPWSTERVLGVTRDRAAAAGLSVRLLPGWYDIDRPEDLARARADAAPGSHLGQWLDGPEGERYIPRA
jgi:rSAM/selenodomain-associated transferase 1